MRELHVVALSEDGQSVLLATSPDAQKGGFRVALDDRLAAALRGDLARPGESRPRDSDLTPKEIQARLRSGESAEQIAQSAGVAVSRVERFSGPVLSERGRVIDDLRAAVLVRGRRGPSALPLGEAVDEQLAPVAREDSVTWGARRQDDGLWFVEVTWLARGRARHGRWLWDATNKVVRSVDPASAALGHLEKAPTKPAKRPPLVVSEIAPARPTAGARKGAAKPGAKAPAGRAAAARKPATKKAAAAATPARKAAPTRAVAKKAPAAATKTAAAKTAATKTAATKTGAAKTGAAKTVAAKTAAKKAPTAKPAATKGSATKAAPRKVTAKPPASTAPASTAPASKAPASNAPAKPAASKAAASTAAASKAPAKRAAAKASTPVPAPAAAAPPAATHPSPGPHLRVVPEMDAPTTTTETSTQAPARARGRASVPAWSEVLLGTAAGRGPASEVAPEGASDPETPSGGPG